MRRIATLLALLGVAGAIPLAAGAGADDSRAYEIEMLNAFGVVEGSEVRVAGVPAGAVTDLGVNEGKRAVATVELSGPVAVLGDRTTCSTEPQSLIAEYFIDCRPRGAPLAEGATIPARRVTQTVQNDLVFNTLRLPYRERLRLIVNEFGTALAGNADNLNQAIRLSVPALTDLRRVTRILVRQRRRLAGLNVDSSEVLARLAARREDVAGAIAEARDVAVAGADRREDLARDVDLLDDVAAELRPTLSELGETARAGTPLLASLRASAPGLNLLAKRLPGFSRAGERALAALGRAAEPGTRALERGADEVRALRRAGDRAAPTAEILADLLRDLSDPDRTVEIDARAARTCDDPSRPCYGTGRPAPTGFTGIESILNYTYYQSLALNQFDSVGHILQFNVYSGASGPCDDFNAGPDVPAAGGGRTTDILEADPCVNWLGPNQPDVSFDLGLPPYDPSVCPNGSTDLALCDPAGSEGARPAGGESADAGAATPAASGAPDDQGDGPDQQAASPDAASEAPDQQAPVDGLDQILDDVLDDLPADLGEGLQLGQGTRRAEDRRAAARLLDFLVGP